MSEFLLTFHPEDCVWELSRQDPYGRWFHAVSHSLEPEFTREFKRALGSLCSGELTLACPSYSLWVQFGMLGAGRYEPTSIFTTGSK